MDNLFKIIIKSCDTCGYVKWPKKLKCNGCKNHSNYRHLKGDVNEKANQ